METFKEKKEWLSRYRKNREVINRLEEKLANLDTQIYKIRTVSYSDQPKGGIPVTLNDLLTDKVELEDRINRLSKKGRKIKAEIIDKIDSLDNRKYCEILEAYFIDCKTLVQISYDMGYSDRHTRRMYSEAMQIINI